MTIAILVIVTLNLVAVSAILGLIVFDRRRHRQAAVMAQLAGKRQFITIEILNANELAASQSKLALVAGTLAPSYVRGMVYEQVAKQMKHEFTANGVDADIAVHVN